MHSIFILVCCLALFYSNPTKAENERPSILFSEPHDLTTYDITSEPKFDIISKEEDETQSLPESRYPPITPIKSEETAPQSLLATPAENISKSSPEGKEQEQKNTWAIWDEDMEKPSSSNLANVNSTMPFALTNSAISQEPTSTPIDQALPASFESIPHTDANTLASSNPSSLGVPATPSSVQTPDAINPTASQTLVNSKSEPSASPNLSSVSESVPFVQSITPTSSATQIISSVHGDDFSSSGTLSTGSDAIATPTQQLAGTAASNVPYPSLDSRPSNSTLPTTSYESTPTQETSSLFDSKPKLTSSDSSSTILSTATFSYSTSSSLNTTQTLVSSSTTAILTSIGLQPLPTNGSTSVQTSTFVTSGTAIYPSSTSSTLAPITGNGTATTTPSYSTITIPLLTTTLPQQSSSLSSSHNITYTSIPPSNFTSSYYNLPSSTQTSIKTTLSTVPSIIKPTATNTASTFIPSSIIAQTSSTRTSGQLTQTQATGIPSALPKIVQNPLSSSTPTQPVDTSEVQIGFEWALNYPFVVSHPLSTTQIFTYLPIGIADGLGLKPEQIVVKNLLPLDTTAELQFITTVARVFIPSSMVDTLRVDLGIAASPIYQNPDESVNTLMNYINPAIPFFPGAVLDPGATPTGSDTKNTQNTTPGDTGIFNSGTQQPQSPSAKGTTAGIAIAACGGAAAYGAAMFLLARRYKHRQQRQKYTSPIDYAPEAGEESQRAVNAGNFGDAGALMSGGRASPTTHDRHSRGSGRTGNTTRNAQISAPMMAENSLGWN